jgi:glycosyltransferase involved in cell wall biosynthesis
VANFRPVICSDACGAAVDLVEHGQNGWILQNPTPEDIADKFLDFELTSLLELENMSRASFEFANLYGPNTWIDFLNQITA